MRIRLSRHAAAMLVVGAGVGYGDGAPSITQGGPLNGLVDEYDVDRHTKR